MTTWNEVVGRAKRTARSLQLKGRATARYENSHGVAVDGWMLSQLGSASDPIVYRGTDYDECFADYRLILGTNGVIYQTTLLHTEEGRRESDGFRVTVVKSPSVHQLHPQGLHPVENRRFRYDALVAALDALAQKSNSSPEPAAPKADKSETFSEYDKPAAAKPQPAPRRPEAARARQQHAQEPERKSSRGGTVLLMAAPFIFLAVLLVILLLNGVEFN